MSADTYLGIELGSTRIKACLVGPDGTTIATGSHSWENQLVDGVWTYSLEAVHAGVRSAYADLVASLGAAPAGFGAIGVSAMMHGYLAFDAAGEPLVPFRTWRNTSTGPAAAALSAALGVNIPLRWSIAHLHQAILDREPHVPHIARLTTLAGYVHTLLTGREVLGVGDASGMFPIDPATGGYDRRLLDIAEGLAAAEGAPLRLAELLPTVLTAGDDAGSLSAEGAAFLDASGTLQPGVPLCPPEGDAGTGMVATDAVRPRTANVSAGTSIFAMVVLERAPAAASPEIDVVTTPHGLPVAMVHCNNGSSELGAWMAVFHEFAAALGVDAESDAVFAAALGGALEARDDGLLAYNLLAGEPILGTAEGRPLIVRTPGSSLTLAGFGRAQLFSVFATLALGMRGLAADGVGVDSVVAHGGLFRTGHIAQRALAAALATPVSVGEGAGEGGAWGIALLAAFRRAVLDGSARGRDLGAWLAEEIFPGVAVHTATATRAEVADYAAYLDRWQLGLAVERAAIEADAAPRMPDPASVALAAAIQTTRENVARLHAELTRYGLVIWTGGNISGRVPGADLFVIKPSGVSYDELAPDNMILCDLDGNVIAGTPGSDRSPSSDTAAHAYVYRNMPQVGGVVHTHSTYATAWAARGEAIPCVITGMADEFGGEIPVGPFAIIGDDSIGRGIVATLDGHRSRAVLMRNHGVFTIGTDAQDAVKAAVMCEDVARTTHIARQLGELLPMPEGSIDALFDRYQNVYGQKPQGALT